MFFLSLIEHTVQLRPHLLDLPLNEAVKGEFESLFLDKIIVNLGLCISVYDMRSIDGGLVFPRDGVLLFLIKIFGFHTLSILFFDTTKIDDFERLRPEELNQQNIEALVAENNLERVKERSVHSKETPQFMSGAQSLENITSKGTAETGSAVCFSDDEDLSRLSGSKSTTRGRSSSSATFKSSHDASEHGKGKTYFLRKRRNLSTCTLPSPLGHCFAEERVKERSVHSKETPQFMSGAQSLENITSKGTAETGSAVSFSDDEDLSQLSGSKSTTKGRSSSSATFKYSHDASEHGKGKTCT
ncbi:unnamed protein product, partial [Vitis vinifera]